MAKNKKDPLTAYERKTLLPAVCEVISFRKGKQKRITNKKIISLYLNDYIVNPAQLRKILHHIRTNNLIEGIIATSQGYYIADTREEFDAYLQSLRERVAAIMTLYRKTKEQRDRICP